MQFSSSQMHQIQHFPGSAPDPTGGAFNPSPDPLAGGEGARCPIPKNPSPALGPSGLERRPFGPRTQHTHILSRDATYGYPPPAIPGSATVSQHMTKSVKLAVHLLKNRRTLTGYHAQLNHRPKQSYILVKLVRSKSKQVDQLYINMFTTLCPKSENTVIINYP